MGAREINVMDSSGHTKHIWDSEKPEEVVAARELYNSLTKNKKYRAFYVKKDGDEGKPMEGFDPEAEKMILVPAIVGG